MNVPQLRFDGFDEEWRKIKIGQVLSESKEIRSGKSNLPIATSSRKGLFLQSDYFNGKRSYDTDNINFKLVPKGFITYRHMSDDSTFHFNINKLADEILVSPEYPVFNTTKDADIQFILYHLNSSDSFKNFCVMQKLGGTRTRLYYKKLENYQLSIPSLEEQKKISSFLCLLSKKIVKQQEKIEKLEQFKKGMMQKIFSQELRFKDEDGGEFPKWDKKKLGEVCKITTGKLDANAMQSRGRYRFYTCAKEHYRIDNYAFDTEALLVSGNGANVGYIHYYKGKFNAYQRTYVLDNFTENIIFLKFFLERYLSKRILAEKNVGNTPYIVLGTLYDMSVHLPNLREQSKIARFLTELDKKLEQEKEKLLALEEQKRGFMQGMFI